MDLAAIFNICCLGLVFFGNARNAIHSIRKDFRILLEREKSLVGSPSWRGIHSALQRKAFPERHWLDKLGLGPWRK